MRDLPSGTVTFLFTDIEASTRLLHELGEQYAEVLSAHRRVLRGAFDEQGGVEVDTQGDAFFVAFADAEDAAAAAVEAQRALASYPWPGELPLRVRMGLHTGEPLVFDEGYVGVDVHRGARICSAAYGGQVLLSSRTSELLQANSFSAAALRDLGLQPLKDFPEPERLFQLAIGGLPNEFPPPRVGKQLPAAAGLPDYSLPPADVPCPYKGLVAFQPEDSEVFFGREQLVDDLAHRLEDVPFLGVVGPSGSGKSSLVRAGVVPELQRRRGGDDEAPIILFTPGERPLAELARGLAGPSDLPAPALLERMRQSPASLTGAIRRAIAGSVDAATPVLVIDQFEEVFTLCRAEEERRAFIEALLEASRNGGVATVILALRADFYGHCAFYPSLGAALEENQALVGPMGAEELRRAIERPAEHAGLALEPGLVETILRDVVGEPGALPLLSHCLLETWKRRSGRLLTLIGYLQAGGVQGAIAKTADVVFHETLAPPEQGIARSIFLRLTEIGEGTEDTRRRVRLDELILRREDAASVERVLNVLVGARLVTAGEGTVEVAHEALIRHWPTLRAWLDEDREGRLVHRRLTEAALEWTIHDRDAGALYRGARLASALEWAHAHVSDLNELERDFLGASQAAELSELDAARRRNRRLRALVAGLALLLAGAVAASVLAVRETGRAERQERVALSQSIATQAETRLAKELDLALLLALEAYRLSPTYDARSAVLAAIRRTDQVFAILRGHRGEAGTVAFSPDGRTIASGGEDGKVVLWDVPGRRPRGDPPSLEREPVTSVAFAGDGTTLAWGTNAGSLVFWDLARNRMIGRPLVAHRGPVNVLAFGRGGGEVMSGSSFDGTVRLWHPPAQRPLRRPVEVRSRPTSGLGVSPDLRTIAAPASDGSVSLWDARTGRRLGQPVRRGSTVARSVAFSPAGGMLAIGQETGTIVLWDVRRRHPLPLLRRVHRAQVTALAFSRDGRVLISGGADGTVGRWDVARGRLLGKPLRTYSGSVNEIAAFGSQFAAATSGGAVVVWSLDPRRSLAFAFGQGVSPTTSVAFGASDRVLASGSVAGTVSLWDVARGRRLGRPLAGSPTTVNQIAVSPDGRTVAATRADATLTVASVARPEEGKMVSVPIYAEEATSVAFDRSGRLVAAGSDNGSVFLWDVAEGRRVGSLRAHETPVTDARFSPRESILASSSQDGAIAFWDVERRVRLGMPLRHDPNGVNGIAFNPDGSMLASAGAGGTVILWDVDARRRIGEPVQSGIGDLASVDFSPDGKTLATGNFDGAVVLLDVRSRRLLGQPLASPKSAQEWVGRTIAFSPGGRLLVASGSGSMVRWPALLWADEEEVFADWICGLVTRTLSKPEWAELLPAQSYRPAC